MLKQLKQVLELTGQLAEHLRLEQFDQASAVQEQRLILLQGIAQSPLPERVEEQQEIADITLEIKKLEESLSQQLQADMKQLLNEDQAQKRRSKMVKAYQQFNP